MTPLMHGQLAPYTVKAHNSARDSENRMHDDQVARTLGFKGGLVPGVDVFAYISHVPLQFWGRAFLERGRLESRFLKPLYEDDVVTITAREDEGSLQLEASSKGEVIAVGRAALPAAAPDVSVERYESSTPPDELRRPEVGPSSFKVGEWLGIRPQRFTAASHAEHLKNVRETDPLYAGEGIVHPGSLLRLANFVLVHNVRLGPWIHVSGTLQMMNLARVGDELTVRAQVTKNYEKKGRKFEELDALVVANGSTPIAQIHHNAIYA